MSNIHISNNKNNNRRKFSAFDSDSQIPKRLSSPSSFSDRKINYNDFRRVNKQVRPPSKNDQEKESPSHLPACQSARYPAQLDFQSEYLRFWTKSNSATSSNSTANQDNNLLQSMTSKLFEFQQEIQHLKNELDIKNSQLELKQKEITALKLQANKYKNKGEEFLQLCQNCEKLEKTLEKAEKFLKDYDLSSENKEINIQEEVENPVNYENMTPIEIDFELLLEKFEDLNILAGEGSSQIVYTNDGATFKLPEEIPITLFLNGMMLFSGPFRDYHDRTTQLFLRDIFDGYFPAELQTSYPNGVPFKIIDKHNTYYDGNKRKLCIFSGPGHRLGRKESARPINHHENKNKKNNQNLYSNQNPLRSYFKSQEQKNSNQNGQLQDNIKEEEASQPYTRIKTSKNIQMTKEQLLERLPPCTIKGGRIIDIRNSVAEFITPTKEKPPVQFLKHSSYRNGDSIRLKIRSFEGEKIYLILISAKETVHAIYKVLDSVFEDKNCKYKIMDTISRRELPNEDLPLKNYDIANDCVLILQKKESL